MAVPVRWEMGPEWDGHNSVDEAIHKALALWAADCAEHVLHYFADESPDDDRPRTAIEAARAWGRDEITMSESREAALAAHAAARDADQTAAREAACATGHAAATAHVDDHATGAANYAIKAVIDAATLDTDAAESECEWQWRQRPEQLRAVVTIGED